MSSKSKSTAHPAHPSTEDHVQDHPHACLNGYVYLGYTYVGEDGEEYEAFEALPCRRCASAQAEG